MFENFRLFSFACRNFVRPEVFRGEFRGWKSAVVQRKLQAVAEEPVESGSPRRPVGSSLHFDQYILISTCRSVEVESDFYADLHVHRFAIFKGRLKAPLFDRFDGLGVQAKAQAADDANVARLSGSVDDHPEDAGSLSLGATRFLGIVRIWRGNGLRRGDSTADLEDTAANAPAAAGADARAMTGTHATP
jgi:hypothetical protein